MSAFTPRVDLSTLQTESRNDATKDIDIVSTLEMCPQSVSHCLPTIASIVDQLAARLPRGGRVVYIGAGTSGRLGVLDASEIMIAGGDRAIRNAVEGAEDSLVLPVSDLSAISPPLSPELDTVIGLAASGRTPYVLAGLKYARELGCFTAGICCVKPSQMRGVADEVIECPVGGEVVTGSTRLKSGTAQKMMVDVKSSNIKLVNRSRKIIRAVLEPLEHTQAVRLSIDLKDDAAVDKLVQLCAGSTKQAIVAARWSCSPEESLERLRRVDGVLKKAIEL
ncbi:hypothetical protein P7C73_g967, partial [Tremellales sp. Uapishka_1]